MDMNLPRQDDPEKTDKSSDQESDNLNETPFTNQIKPGAMQEIPDENVINEIWRSLGDESTPPEAVNKPASGIGSLIKRATDRLKPAKTAGLPDQGTPAANQQSNPPKKTSSLPAAGREKQTPPASNFYPFDNSDVRTPGETASLSRNDLRNLTTKKLQDSKRIAELNQASTINRVDDEIARRIKAIRSESPARMSEASSETPPFVVEDDLYSYSDEKFDTLANKVKRGSLPPETIRLLITTTMPEEEVILVCRDLGIDWDQIPEETREKKILFLIEYFTNKGLQESHTLEDVPTLLNSKSVFLGGEIEQDWLESENRLQALQETLNVPAETVEQKPNVSFLEHLKDEFDQSSSFIKVLMVSLSVIALIIILAIVFFLVSGKRFTPPVLAVPTYTQFPTPKALQFPGGWIFNLKIGSVRNGSWNPTSPEWLDTTEICKLVSLPWNKQINAIYLTFQPGDEILMTMSNGDLVRYKVISLKTIKLSEMDQFTNCSSPSLIVVLTQKETVERQMLIATLNNSILNAQITVTAVPAQDNLNTQSAPTTVLPQITPTP
jgi:hypothetical protein